MAASLVRQGKVRDIYDLGDRYLLVASDRISAFDWVIPTAIPDKGRVLTQITQFWLETFDIPNHLLGTAVRPEDCPEGVAPEWLAGRSMVVKKCEVVPVECVVRGYLVGSGWKEYQQTQSVCGVALPEGLVNCSQLETPIFTPATKEEEGHDVNISFERMTEIVGEDVSRELMERSLDLYERGARYAAERGIIIADTKFEWGWHDGELILIDEALTPDSSRFWPADQYQPGSNPLSFDKQFVRDYLETTSWDKSCLPPTLPEDIVQRTRAKYIEAYERLTGRTFAWS